MIIARRSFTQMKKTLILGMALFLAIPFTACNGGSKSNFKDYSYKDELEDTEKYAVLANMQAKLGEVSSMEGTMKINMRNAINSLEEEVKESVTVYSNHGYEAKGSDKIKRSEEGLTKQTEETTSELSFLVEDANLIIQRDESSEDGVEFHTFAAPEENAGEYFDKSVALQLYSNLSTLIAHYNPDAFKVSGGWEFTVSAEQETHTYEMFSDFETIDINRSQWSMVVDKEYRIKTITSFSEQLSNVDPGTGERLKKVEQFQQTVSKTEYKYGKKKAGNFTAVKDEFSSGYLKDLAVTVASVGFTKPAEEWVPATQASGEVAKRIIQKGAKEAHFEAMYSINSGALAERTGALIQLTGTAMHALKDDEPKAISAYVTGEVENVTVTTIAEVPYLMFAEEYYTGSMMYVEFDIAFEAGDAGATVSNLVIKLIPPVVNI